MSSRDAEAGSPGTGPVVYRLVVEGELAQERAEWFGAESLVAAAGVTTMHVGIADQADLHGLLRRVRDMNLRIVQLARVGTQ